MSDTNHMLIEFLNDFGMDVFLAESNFQYYENLKEALIKDVKGYKDNSEVSSPFFKTLNDTDDLFNNQAMFLHAMISAWSLSVVEDLRVSLNDIVSETSDIIIGFDGYLDNPTLLYFDGIKDYVSSIEIEDIDDALDVLNRWKNTLELIAYSDELIEKLRAKKTQVA